MRHNQGRRMPSHWGGSNPRRRHVWWVPIRHPTLVVIASLPISPKHMSVSQADESPLSSGKSLLHSLTDYSDLAAKFPSIRPNCRKNYRVCYDSKAKSGFLYILIIRGCRLAPSSRVSPPSPHPSRPTLRHALAFAVYSRSTTRIRRISRVLLLSCSPWRGTFPMAVRACQPVSEGRGRRRWGGGRYQATQNKED